MSSGLNPYSNEFRLASYSGEGSWSVSADLGSLVILPTVVYVKLVATDMKFSLWSYSNDLATEFILQTLLGLTIRTLFVSLILIYKLLH